MFDSVFEPLQGEGTPPPGAWQTPWFLVSTRKLVVLSLVSFTLYQYLWFFKQWQAVRDVQRRNVWATPRGLFNVVSCYSLFRRMLVAAARDGGQPRRLAVPLALAYVIGFLCQYLPEPAMLLTFLSVVPLAVAQSIVNRMAWVEVVPREFRNDRFTLANWLWIVVGGLFLLLYVLGLAFPATFGVDAVGAE